jgi:hypothetical protein
VGAGLEGQSDPLQPPTHAKSSHPSEAAGPRRFRLRAWTTPHLMLDEAALPRYRDWHSGTVGCMLSLDRKSFKDASAPMAGGTARGSKFIFGLVIFSSAFLLFQVEPVIGKNLLPWFGGAAGMWIVCLLFFQVLLLLGYLYAHLLTRIFSAGTQVRIHTALLVASLLSLPILPKSSWKLSTAFRPAFHILLLLVGTVGCPIFCRPPPAPSCRRGMRAEVRGAPLTGFTRSPTPAQCWR